MSDPDIGKIFAMKAEAVTHAMRQTSNGHFHPGDGRTCCCREERYLGVILHNTYRLELLTGHFNGLVSNPPWLAMSGISDNPYRTVLTGRANFYGIRPPGQSFLNLELGTTHLLHAVDRYLRPGTSIHCLSPSLARFSTAITTNRCGNGGLLSSERPIALEISGVWQVAPGNLDDGPVAGSREQRVDPHHVRFAFEAERKQWMRRAGGTE